MIRGAEGRSPRLERRLAELCRRRAAGGEPEAADGTPPAGAGEDGPGFEGLRVEEVLPGGVLEADGTRVFLHERLRSSIERPKRAWGTLRPDRRRGGRTVVEPEWAEAETLDGTEAADPWEEAPWGGGPREELRLEVLHEELRVLHELGLERAVFLDIETGGLSQACVFLAGTMQWSGSDFVLRQYFARDYSEEPGLLVQLGRQLAAAEAVITFNGKAFDLPFLRDRAVVNGLSVPLPAHHVDLLHHARARWREELPNCRLVTLEAWICRRRRVGDVPGDRIPGLYHAFVRHGEPERLIPVFHHNLLDVITMEDLLRALFD